MIKIVMTPKLSDQVIDQSIQIDHYMSNLILTCNFYIKFKKCFDDNSISEISD